MKAKYWKDWANRVGWTLIAVVLGAVSVQAIGLPDWAIVPAATLLTALKGLVARKIGDPETATFGPA